MQSLIPDHMQNEPEQTLFKQGYFISERIKLISKLTIKQEINDNPVMMDNLISVLQKFYESISPLIRALIPDYAIHMSQKHSKCLKETGHHPEFYESHLTAAKSKIASDTYLKQLNIEPLSCSTRQTEFNKIIIEANEEIDQAMSNISNINNNEEIDQTIINISNISNIENLIHHPNLFKSYCINASTTLDIIFTFFLS